MRNTGFLLRMKIVPRLSFVALAIVSPVLGGSLWYNGDWNNVDFLRNDRDPGLGTPSQFNVYDDFIVPNGQTWNVTAVFSNDAISAAPTSADWAIRSGVSPGNGGVLIASGTGPVTLSPTGRSCCGNLVEFTVAVSGLNVMLSPGTYWLMVAPVFSTNDSGFDTTTSGANAIGLPAGNDGNAFWNTNSGSFFVPTTTVVGDLMDFSMGVNGTVASQNQAPEPGSLVLLCMGVLGGVGRALTAGRRVR